ncbi:MAG TPA: chromate transporter [Gemmatimonadales bacterium]|nr:chromate transporter [Gemmatimonadales bacterium]
MQRPLGLRAFLLYFLRLGTLGFGGPIALAGHMQQDLVEQRGWISPQEYKEGLALAQLAPGPLAALVLLLGPRKIPEPVLIVAAGLVGLLVKGTR